MVARAAVRVTGRDAASEGCVNSKAATTRAEKAVSRTSRALVREARAGREVNAAPFTERRSGSGTGAPSLRLSRIDAAVTHWCGFRQNAAVADQPGLRPAIDC